MLFNKDPKYTQDLRLRVLQVLNDKSTGIMVLRFCCIGYTNADGQLVVYTSKKKKRKHLCDPLGATLFYLRCFFPDKQVNKSPAIAELLKIFAMPKLPKNLTVNGYSLTEPQHGPSLYNVLKRNITPDSVTVFHNLSCSGQFILCSPLYANIIIKCTTPFNEEEALRTLGGLTDAIFVETKYTMDNLTHQAIPNIYGNVTKKNETSTTPGILEPVNLSLPFDRIPDNILPLFNTVNENMQNMQNILDQSTQSSLDDRMNETSTTPGILEPVNLLPLLDTLNENIQNMLDEFIQSPLDNRINETSTTPGILEPVNLLPQLDMINENIPYKQEDISQPLPIQATTHYSNKHDTDNTSKYSTKKGTPKPKWYTKSYLKRKFANIIFDTQNGTEDNACRELISQSPLDDTTIYENIPYKQEPISQSPLDDTIYENIPYKQEPISQSPLDDTTIYENIPYKQEPISQSPLDDTTIYENIPHKQEDISQPLPIQATTHYSNKHDTDNTSKYSTKKGTPKPKWYTKSYLKRKFANIIFDTQNGTEDNACRELISQSPLDDTTIYENIPYKQEPISQSPLDDTTIYENIPYKQEPISQSPLDDTTIYENIPYKQEPISQSPLDDTTIYEKYTTQTRRH